MGGVGYMDEPDEPEFNISRLYRDTAANMTWEGTTNVLSSEVVRHMLNGNNLDIFSSWFQQKVLARIVDGALQSALTASWRVLKQRLLDGRDDMSSALADGRQIMFSLAWVISGALLAHDAQRDSNAAAMEVARRWVLDQEGGVGEHIMPDVVFASKRRQVETRERLEWDCRLVWGVELPVDAALGYRAPIVQSSGAPEKLVARL